MKTYDFSPALVSLNGVQIQDLEGPLTCSKLLAGQIANQTSGPIVKLVNWARELWDKNTLTVSDQDIAFIENMIENNMNGTPVFLKAQLLDRFKV